MPRIKARRAPLTRERVLQAALDLADEHGVGAVSMRQLAMTLGFGVMSLYNHVSDKDDVLDGMIDLVASEIELPPAGITGEKWKPALRSCAISAYRTLLRHRWVCSLWATREPGPARQRYSEAILRVLRESGFSEELACRGLHALTMHVVGFALQAIEMPFHNKNELAVFGRQMLSRLPVSEYPYLVEHIKHHLTATSERNDFKYMLDLILDGLERDLN